MKKQNTYWYDHHNLQIIPYKERVGLMSRMIIGSLVTAVFISWFFAFHSDKIFATKKAQQQVKDSVTTDGNFQKEARMYKGTTK